MSNNDYFIWRRWLPSCDTFKQKIMDDKKKKGKADDIRIDIHDRNEVRYWTERLNVTEQRLKEAVKAVGVMVKNVKAHLEQNS